MLNKNMRMTIAGICLLIPFVIFFDVPLYDKVAPSFGGLPFYYWFQIIMLPISAVLFLIAAKMIDSKNAKR